jgi:hypothetical protein
MKILKKTIGRILFTLVLVTIALTAITSQVNAPTWSGEIQLTTDPYRDQSPVMIQAIDGRIWVFWHSYRTGNAEIYYKIYDGAWSNDTQLTNDPNADVNPAAIQAINGIMWVFWATNRYGPSGNYEIVYMTSLNNGVTWSSVSRITFDVHDDRRPSVMQAADGKIWVAWHSPRTGNFEIFYTYYDGSWASFGTQLTNNSYTDVSPSIIQTSDGKMWIFWSSYKTGDYEIFYTTSTDGGSLWLTEVQLTVDTKGWDQAPFATQVGNGKIWVVWETDRGGNDFDIYYKIYDGSWSSDSSLVTNNAEDTLPSVFQAANTTIWVTWSSTRGVIGDYNIFYKLTLADYDVAVQSVTAQSTLAYQGYNRQVQVKVKNEGLLSATFSVTAYCNSSPIGTQAVTGLASNTETTLTFLWDTTGLAYGHYVLSATASGLVGEEDLTDNSLSGDVVLLTVPGDVNGDKVVNVVDAASNSAHWYPGPPVGPLGYSVTNDINIDGNVDIIDSAIVSAHWGQSW